MLLAIAHLTQSEFAQVDVEIASIRIEFSSKYCLSDLCGWYNL